MSDDLIPKAEAFKDSEGAISQEFMAAPAVQSVAERLINELDAFAHLRSEQLVYLWKRQGGKRRGKAVRGSCQKPAGLLEYFSDAQFLIWLAADNCRAEIHTPREFEALVFKQLCHAGKEGKVLPNDFEGFKAEVDRYGFWTADLKLLKQMPLFVDGAADTRQPEEGDDATDLFQVFPLLENAIKTGTGRPWLEVTMKPEQDREGMEAAFKVAGNQLGVTVECRDKVGADRIMLVKYEANPQAQRQQAATDKLAGELDSIHEYSEAQELAGVRG